MFEKLNFAKIISLILGAAALVLCITLGCYSYDGYRTLDFNEELLLKDIDSVHLRDHQDKSFCKVTSYLESVKGAAALSDDNLGLIRNCQRFVYGRTPKCGSRGTREVFRGLAMIHHFKALDKRDESRPVTYIKSVHTPYRNFSSDRVDEVAVLNVIRHPIDHFISVYSFKKFGSEQLDRNRSFGDWERKIETEMNLNVCIEKRGVEKCSNDAFSPLRYSCGTDPVCKQPKLPEEKQERLQKAMFNAENRYLLVGVTEEQTMFFEILETLVPKIFTGAVRIHKRLLEESVAKWKTRYTYNLTQESRDVIEREDSYAFHLYYFVKAKLYQTLYKVREYEARSR